MAVFVFKVSKKVLIGLEKTVLKKFNLGIKDAEIDADFESIEKVAKNLLYELFVTILMPQFTICKKLLCPIGTFFKLYRQTRPKRLKKQNKNIRI
jgi:hypothetical protein